MVSRAATVFAVLAIAAVCAADDINTWENDGIKYDLSPLTLDSPYSVEGKMASGDPGTFFFNVGRDFAVDDSDCPDGNHMVFIVSEAWESDSNDAICRVVADKTDNPFAAVEGGLTMTLNGPTDCKVTFNFKCKEDGDAGTPEAPETTDGCKTEINWTTKYACPQKVPDPSPDDKKPDEPESGGLSWGWIIIIIVVCLLPFYIGIGIFVNYKYREKRGLEVLPNFEFWKNLPGFVWDGCGYWWHLNKCLYEKIAGCIRARRSKHDYSLLAEEHANDNI